MNLSGTDGFLQLFEGFEQALVELVAGDFTELGFRIVDVVDVDALKIEVAQAASELVRQVTRCHAVATADEIGRRQRFRI